MKTHHENKKFSLTSHNKKMLSHIDHGIVQRSVQVIITSLAFIGLFLFTGCSDDLPVEADTLYDVEAQANMNMMNGKGLTVQEFPSAENPGPPLYASGLSLGLSDFGATRTDGEWVAITFVRDPDCIPPDYNLLSAPNIPAVFGCELTIEGRVWLRDASNLNDPSKAQHSGLGEVPVYFVTLEEFDTAVMDMELTITELNGLSSLQIGYASYHLDVIQFPQDGRPGKHSIVSRGELEDGRSFEHIGVVVGTTNQHTSIRFE